MLYFGVALRAAAAACGAMGTCLSGCAWMSFEISLEFALSLSAAAALGLAFLLSAVFLRGRAALAALLLLWSWAGLALSAGHLPSFTDAPARIEAVLLFAPLNMLFLASIAETVFWSRIGLVLGALITVQTFAAWVLPAEFWDAVWRIERMPARYVGELFRARTLPPPGLSMMIGLLGASLALGRGYLRRDVVLYGVAIAALAAGWIGYGLLLGVSVDPALMMAGVGLAVAASWASYRMAFLDALTQLPGRRMLDERMARLGRRWAVAMIDVDHFKKFNDSHGHDVGDDVLRMVAAKLRKHFGSDAYRFGGEEFAVLFAGRSDRDAVARCEAFRADVAGHEMVVRSVVREGKGKRGAGKSKRHKTVSVTVSIGIAQRTARRRRPEVVLKAADVSLYDAKKAGRNRVIEHSRDG